MTRILLKSQLIKFWWQDVLAFGINKKAAIWDLNCRPQTESAASEPQHHMAIPTQPMESIKHDYHRRC